MERLLQSLEAVEFVFDLVDDRAELLKRFADRTCSKIVAPEHAELNPGLCLNFIQPLGCSRAGQK